MIGATGAGFSICSILFVEHLSFFNLNLLIFLYGIFSSSEIIVFAMAKEISGARITGTVFAVTNMIVSLVGALFQPLVGWLLDTFGHPIKVTGHYQYQIIDYQQALLILPISLLLVIILCFFVGQLKPAK
jgi:MFS family permease